MIIRMTIQDERTKVVIQPWNLFRRLRSLEVDAIGLKEDWKDVNGLSKDVKELNGDAE